MNSRDIDELMRMQDIVGRNSTQRLIEQAEQNALRESRHGLLNLTHDPFSRMSEAERRFLTEPRPEFERLASLQAHELSGGYTRAAEMAFERMREVADAASKFRTGGELFDYFEQSGRAERQALAAFEGHREVERLWKGADAGWEHMLRSERLLARAGVFDHARDAATAYYTSMDAVTRRLVESEALNPNSTKYVAGLIEPLDYHARFSMETLNRLNGADLSSRESAALGGSLTLFNDQITRLTAAVAPMIQRPGRIVRVRPPRVEFNLPATQQRELLDRTEEVPEDAGYEALAPLAPSSQLVDDAIACVMLYERCNEARRLRGEEPFFKPTTRGTVAACWIGMIVADDRDKFDLLIDQLYMLIYEGAGGQKQKYLVEYGGIMERPECDAVWDIKQLRSKRSRHDIEHGSEGDIRKKYRDLGEMYRRLGLSRFPQTPDEYALLQREVLRNLRAFMTELAERIERGGAAPPASE
jgi:hypothetical protein